MSKMPKVPKMPKIKDEVFFIFNITVICNATY
jgi:hypothetical protein